ncbi:uncharacterized protein LOC123216451 [Mangifera indica]|uniref:uncharacterized protein LOC123216451 n=1 Tax=Mangifera indica TaxID=29780 RepID=UPI001CFA98F0|nr:uncharacterized protein LOC123216451 [Mangifera indica]
MRCKKHQSDFSSSIGVCASCLRERLFVLIAAQAQVQPQPQAQRDSLERDRRKQQDPPPLIFPRSVSPYVTRRKSDDTTTAFSRHNRFYSTPQVGPTFDTFSSTASAVKKYGKLSIFSNLFKSRSEKFNSDPTVPHRDSCDSSSSSFLSTIFRSRRKKESTFCYPEESKTGGRAESRVSNRGMSPAKGVDYDEDCDRSPSGSGESSEEWRKTPMTAAAAVRRTRTVQNRNVSGLAFCLSPLVRASPSWQWKQKGGLPPDIGFSGEIRGTVKPHLSTAASFYANRSRKLADFGRVNQNR